MITTKITAGIKVSVETYFQPSFSDVQYAYFAFGYRITIENNSDSTIQLLRRHWYITDSNGIKREVEGEGVVGFQPVLKPGETHTYVSGCDFKSEIGRMEGTYLMEKKPEGKLFYVKIPCFDMVAPFKLN